MGEVKGAKPDILDDFWIYLEDVQVEVNGADRDEIEKFRLGRDPRLEFERSSDSMEDDRSIKIYGVTKKFFGENRILLGILPREISQAIINGAFLGDIDSSPPRFRRDGRILLDLLGKRERKKEFEEVFQQVLIDRGFVR